MGTTRPFRFGVTAMPRHGGRAWCDGVRRWADLGFGGVVMPEAAATVSPVPALAAAAAVADVRVGTFVSAVPLRPAGAAAWEAYSLSEITDGRFDLGLGTGLPRTVAEGAALNGTPEPTPGERLDRVRDTVRALREREATAGGHRTPVLIAAGGPRARELAAREADLVTPAAGPDTPEPEIARILADVRERAGDRADDIEVAFNTFVVGDEIPPELRGWIGADAARLVERGALTVLPGDTAAQVDELERRRSELGISYVIVPEMFAAAFAPVVARLAGT